jgi:hypothetical protein
MKITNLIKILGIITSLFLLPSISNAQIQRVWNVPEFLSTMPAPPSTGAKIGFRTINNSVYYWNGSAWVRMAGPGIVDTTYSLSFTSPNLSLLGSGSSVSLTNLYTAGYGLTKTSETWKVDTAAPNGLATRKYALLNPTSIAVNYIATSNGTNLVARNLFDDNNVVEIKNGKPLKLGQWTTAGRPTGVTGYEGYNTTGNGKEWYQGSRWAYALESTFARGTATRVPFFDANGQITDNVNLSFSGTNLLLTYGNGMSFHSTYRANNGSYAIHAHSGGDFRFVGSSDNTTYRHFSFGYYTADNPASTWNQRFAVNSFTGGVGIGTAPGGHVMLPVFGTVASTALGTFANGFSLWMRTTVNATANNHILIGAHINPILNTAGFSGVSRYGIVVDDYNNILNRVSGSTGIGMAGGTGNDIDASAKFEIRSTASGFLPPRMTAANRGTIPSPATGLQVYQTDGAEGYYVKYASGFKRFLVEGEGGDGNGIISALPSGDVNIKTANHLYIKTTGGATGSDIYTGGATYLKTVAGDFGGAVFHADTTGAKDFAYGWQQDDRISVQNGGIGRQVTNLLTDYNPTINFRWVSGVRLDTTSSIHVIRIMWGDKNTNESFPTEFVFSAASPPGSTASAYNFRTSHSVGRLSLNFDNGIYLRKSTKFFLEADSTLSYNFTNNTLQLSAYGTNATTAATLGKTESGRVAAIATDGTIVSSQIVRDTFVTANTSFSVATLLNTCHELNVTMSITAGAAINYSCTLPTPSSTLRGKKVTVYVDSDASGTYGIDILVSGGTSELRYTSNTSTTAPTAQSVLTPDGTVWPNQGASYTFVCKLISGTYYWVLQQQ